MTLTPADLEAIASLAKKEMLTTDERHALQEMVDEAVAKLEHTRISRKTTTPFRRILEQARARSEL